MADRPREGRLGQSLGNRRNDAYGRDGQHADRSRWYGVTLRPHDASNRHRPARLGVLQPRHRPHDACGAKPREHKAEARHSEPPSRPRVTRDESTPSMLPQSRTFQHRDHLRQSSTRPPGPCSQETHTQRLRSSSAGRR